MSILSALVNHIRGGIRLPGAVQRRLEILSVDDGGSAANVEAITRALLAGRWTGGRPVDFLIGPYSSTLNEVASALAHEKGALLVTAGASSPSVFENRPLSFGLLSPASTYLKSGIELLSARHVRSIAFLAENDTTTIQWCDGAIRAAKELGIREVASVRIPGKPTPHQAAEAFKQLRSSDPDAVVGCSYYDVCAGFLAQAAADPGFYVKAMIFTACVDNPKFKDLPKLQTAYVLGVTPWYDKDDRVDDVLGWSPAYFAETYKRMFDNYPPYQAVASFAGGWLLVQAIEAAGSLEPELVAMHLARARNRTVYGDIDFDANRQNGVPFLTLQTMPNGTQAVVNHSNVEIPMPTRKKRECQISKRCDKLDGCLDDGECKQKPCRAGYRKLNSTCEVCPIGYFSPENAENCTACAAGAHSPSEHTRPKRPNRIALSLCGSVARHSAGHAHRPLTPRPPVWSCTIVLCRAET